MTSRKPRVGLLVCLLTLISCAAGPRLVQASLAGATIAINFENTEIRSTSATTLAIVTRTVSPKQSYIECYFQTTGGQIGLRITSDDQRRVEAFFQQIATAAAGNASFQITAYAKSKYQPNGYEANLENDLVYLILH